MLHAHCCFLGAPLLQPAPQGDQPQLDKGLRSYPTLTMFYKDSRPSRQYNGKKTASLSCERGGYDVKYLLQKWNGGGAKHDTSRRFLESFAPSLYVHEKVIKSLLSSVYRS